MNSNSPYYPLVQIISQGWDENPSNRPEASELLLSVEKIWKDIRRGRIQVIEVFEFILKMILIAN